MSLSNKSFLTGKHITITGGTGFIGSHLLEKILKQKPAKILILSRGSSTERIAESISHVKVKVYTSSEEYAKNILAFSPEYLFILGGNADPRLSLSDPRNDLEHNLLYNFNLLETLKKNKKLKIKIIYISSVAVYGENDKDLLKEENPTSPKSPYGINKLAMEGYLRFFSETSSIKGFSIRLFSTYGPKLYKQVVYDFVKKLIDNPKSLTIRGDGSEVRDLSFVDDQVDGILLLAKKAKYQGEVYNLGSGVGISVAELAVKIAQLMKINPKIVYKKEIKEKHHGSFWIGDISKVKRLGHLPKIKIDQGLKKTIEWIKQV